MTSIPLDMAGCVILGDNLPILQNLPSGSADLIYLDPPFNTGKRQILKRLHTVADANGDRTGFAGRRYHSVPLGSKSYLDIFDSYLDFLEPRLRECHRLLKSSGSLYFHIDYREAHYCKILLDSLFGRECFLNEIIWAYDYGGRTTRRWPPKHDTIFVYVKSPASYYFDGASVDRIPYMAPNLAGPEKAIRGKLPTDTWWHTIVPTAGQERTGYPTQKPLGILRRIITASCPPGGLAVDPFAGSGTTGAAALSLGRRFLLIDVNPEAVAIMRQRFTHLNNICFIQL